MLQKTAEALESLRHLVARLNPSMDMRNEFMEFIVALE
jgi:hypothetical protein